MRLRVPLASLASVLLFVLLCAIVAAWAIQLLAPRPPVAPAGTLAQGSAPIDLRQAGSLLGKPPTPQTGDSGPAAPSDIKVAGVIAAGSRGVALLSVNGQPAKPFAVGESVDADTTVVAVAADSVSLKRRGEIVRSAAPERPSLAILTSGPASGSARPATPGAPVPSAPGMAPAPFPAPPPPPAALPAPPPGPSAAVNPAAGGMPPGPIPGVVSAGRAGAAPMLAPTDPPLSPGEPPSPQNAGMIPVPAPPRQ